MEVRDLDFYTNEEEVLRAFGVHEARDNRVRVINMRETYG